MAEWLYKTCSLHVSYIKKNMTSGHWLTTWWDTSHSGWPPANYRYNVFVFALVCDKLVEAIYLNQWWWVYWCIYASLGFNELNCSAELCFLHSPWVHFVRRQTVGKGSLYQWRPSECWRNLQCSGRPSLWALWNFKYTGIDIYTLKVNSRRTSKNLANSTSFWCNFQM